MLDKLLESLLGWLTSRECVGHHHRPSVTELRYNGSTEITVTAPCLICNAPLPVAVVRGAARIEALPEPVILRAVGGTAARYAGTRTET